MATQNRFKTGLDIARYSSHYEKDMAAYDASLNIHNLGSWHGFVAQQNMIAVKKHHKTTSKKIHLSFRLDGCCITFRIWTITRSINA
jgi:isocitrate lyase